MLFQVIDLVDQHVISNYPNRGRLVFTIQSLITLLGLVEAHATPELPWADPPT